mgnify:CR=1 FL=1
MSIRITQNNCVGCGRCIEACPGNLIKKDAQGKAVIKHISDCWGCTSCLKECKTGAISFYLGADMGGAGSTLTAGDVLPVLRNAGMMPSASSLELMWEAEVQVWLYQRNRIFPHGQWRSRMALKSLFRLIRKTLINIKEREYGKFITS